jgi:hypothetical protein
MIFVHNKNTIACFMIILPIGFQGY